MKTDNLKERYLYDVVRRLPPRQQKDVEQELRGLIEDMVEERIAAGVPEQTALEETLLELGEPRKLAQQYRGEARYLIGPEYFDQYLLVMKIVLPCVAFGLLVALFVETILEPRSDLVGLFAEGLASLISGLLQGAFWVTALFAILERTVKARDSRQPQWSPSQLPPKPPETARISRGDSIAGICFTVLITILFCFAPRLMGVYSFDGDLFRSTPIFDLTVLRSMLWLFILCFTLGILKEVIQLVAGRYSFQLACIVTVLNLCSMLLTIFIFADGSIWNPEMALQLTRMFPAAEINFFRLWSMIQTVFPLVVLAGFLLDTVTVLVRGLRVRRAE